MKLVVDGKNSGLIFEIHPKIKSTFDIKGEAAIFDLDIDVLLDASHVDLKFQELPKFPDVPFEISVLADKSVYAAEISSIIEKSNKESIRSIELFSVYEGAPVPEGKKSVSFRIIFASKDATLSPAEIDSLQKGVIDTLAKKGFVLR
jgi:phenylalanyl-tRNA synthetase beta chain